MSTRSAPLSGFVFVTLLLTLLPLFGSCAPAPPPAPPTGRLLLVENNPAAPHRILTYDLETRQTESLFTAPPFTQIHQVSLDGEGIILSYTPPPSGGEGFLDRSGIFLLDLSGAPAEPRPLLGGELSQEYLLQNTLSPDGRFLYYVRFGPDFSGTITTYTIDLLRYDRQLAEVRPVARSGNWPAVSADGRTLAWVTIEPASQARGLVAAEPDGENPRTLIESGAFFDIDLPLFSPDGEWIYFTVAEPPVGTLFDRLLGVSAAEAHSELPSHWWRVRAGGGQAERISGEAVIIRSGGFSPDGRYLAYTSPQGIHLMGAGGDPLEMIPREHLGDIVWLPAE